MGPQWGSYLHPSGKTPHQWEAAGRDPWELCARTWVEELHATEAGLASVGADQRCSITYEGLIGDPHRTLCEVAPEAAELVTFTPHEAPEFEEADLVHLEAAIGLDAPAQIGTAPRSQPVAARQAPGHPQHQEPPDFALAISGVA